jgi:hypothetical protein
VPGGDPIGSTCRSIGLTGEVRQGAECTTSECNAVNHPVLTVDCGREILRYNYIRSHRTLRLDWPLLAPLRLRVLVMSSPDPQHLRDELVQLLDLQLRVLEKASLWRLHEGGTSRIRAQGHERICGLYNQLSKREAAAAA